MKFASKLACIAVFASVVTPAFAGSDSSTPYVYMRSEVAQPWGQATNEDAMDNVFTSGNWTTLYYEEVDPNVLLVSSTKFIFMEGGDSSYAAFEYFMEHYGTNLYTWLYNGGRLVIMSAPNDPILGSTLYLPDNIVLNSDAFYGSASSLAYATEYSNIVFNHPNSTAYTITGDFVSHGYFTKANNTIHSLMENEFGEIILGMDRIGGGLMFFGGLTTDNFQLPQPAAHSLLENILTYTSSVNLS
jgi:hypothetical protein